MGANTENPLQEVIARETFRRRILPVTEEKLHRAPPPDHAVLRRYIAFHGLVDMLVHSRVTFGVCSTMFDVTDGLPDKVIAEKELPTLLELLNDPGLPSNVHLLDESRKSDLLRIVRDAYRISCWSLAGESYSLWHAFSHLEIGVCIALPAKRAVAWARDNQLAYGEVLYVPGKLSEELASQFLFPTDEEPQALIPQAWVKKKFYEAEQEFRFGKPRTRKQLVEAWGRGCVPAPKPEYVGFDPVHWFNKREPLSDCHAKIVVAPKAQRWFLDLVRSTVEKLVPHDSLPPVTELVIQSEIGKELMGEFS